MKSKFKSLALFLLVATILGIAASNIIRIRDIQGDKTGDPTLKQRLGALADSTYLSGIKSNVQDQTDSIKLALVDKVDKLTDGFSLTDSFYTETEVNFIKATLQRGKFSRQIERLTGTDYLFPIAAPSTLTSTLTMTDGYAYYTLYEVTDTVVVNTFQYILSTQGAYTPDNYNGIALLSYNPSTKVYTKIVETANDGTMWSQTASTLQTKTFANQTLFPGFYAVAINYNASASTTAPVIATYGTTNSVISLIYGHQLVGVRTAQAAIPSTEDYSNLFGIGQIVGIILK